MLVMNGTPMGVWQEAIYACKSTQLSSEDRSLTRIGPTHPEPRSVQIVRQRFGLSAAMAAVVASLAGLGPREAQNG